MFLQMIRAVGSGGLVPAFELLETAFQRFHIVSFRM